MKIAIPSTMPDLSGTVEHKLGTAAHLLVVETDDMSFEALDGPPRSSGPGAGVQAVSLVVGMGAQVLLVGHIAPHIANALEKQGIEVVSQVSGSVAEAVADYMGARSSSSGLEYNESQAGQSSARGEWGEALVRGLRQFHSLLPRLVGVILLLGLFRGFVPEQALLSLFSGSILYDSVWGVCLGSVMAGNPVNSYVIGKSLLDAGVGLAGAVALMLAWVNVGVIQMPAESAALGLRFALVRNLAGFAVAVIMSLVVLLWAGGGA